MSKQLPNWLYLLEDVSSSQDFGVGIDIEEVQRWTNSALKLDQLFTQEEREYCESKAFPAEHYAGHWCAKEAIFKAVSSFFQIDLRQISVSHGKSGRPVAKFSNISGDIILRGRLSFSITHSSTLAMAFAIYSMEKSW